MHRMRLCADSLIELELPCLSFRTGKSFFADWQAIVGRKETSVRRNESGNE